MEANSAENAVKNYKHVIRNTFLVKSSSSLANSNDPLILPKHIAEKVINLKILKSYKKCRLEPY